MAPATPEPDNRARLGRADLKEEVPDLTLSTWPPPPRLSFLVGAHTPLQIVGIGLQVEAYAPAWLRLSLLYSAGVSVARKTLLFSNYAEAMIGVGLFAAWSEREVDLFAPEPADLDWIERKRRLSRRVPSFKAWLPSQHLIFVEGGVLTGLLSFSRCIDKCEGFESDKILEEHHRQLLFLTAGVRYVYFVDAASKSKPDLNRRIQGEIYAHVILPPVNDWKAAGAVWGRKSDVDRTMMGGRAGFKTPGCLSGSCMRYSFGLGYLPTPGTVYLEVGTGG